MQLVARKRMRFAGTDYGPGEPIPDTVWEAVGQRKRDTMLAVGKVVPAIVPTPTPTRRKAKKG